MKKRLFTILALTGLLVAVASSCSKDKDRYEEVTPLENKTTDEIKLLLIGNWKVHYAYGGFDGHTKQSFSNKTFRVLANDSIYFSTNNGITDGDKIAYERINTIFGYEATVMNFTSHLDWIVSNQKGDTLILKDHATEPFEYYITRITELKN
ncbi:hypothetical protein [Flavisolibacter tropicus]|uniref:Lipocalin-like domain-containing protein n=1 Tax=Flavisolibacter tropicus TaxID=1492898 RepID=A0A172TWR4_9BACT|nr:hypothetical protein [Flavisolibacter tropicus]ANE51177.1 hypothetical protein SY85_12360 [Flavisolibacter tropicus]